jgi:hypothetical protein
MSPFCLVSILEDVLFRRQPNGWTPNWSRSFSPPNPAMGQASQPLRSNFVRRSGPFPGSPGDRRPDFLWHRHSTAGRGPLARAVVRFTSDLADLLLKKLHLKHALAQQFFDLGA